MIVLDTLQELFASDVRFGSVEIEPFGRLDHPTRRMFDGGLMVISEEFLTHKTKDKLIEISKLKQWSSDEPVLNLFFEDAITFLPKKYKPGRLVGLFFLSYTIFFALRQYLLLNRTCSY